MTQVKEQSREAAVQKAINELFLKATGMEAKTQWLTLAGTSENVEKELGAIYDAGLAAAADQWVRIETVDDLPRESGKYLWRYRDGCGEGYPYTYRPTNPEFNEEAFLIRNFSHWQKITAPQEDKING